MKQTRLSDWYARTRRCRNRIALLLGVTGLATVLVPAHAERQQTTLNGDSRIVGGQPANANAYPWMAALLQAGVSNAAQAQFCGGSLIRADWVLTAAHCIEQADPAQVEVLLGQNDLNAGGGERIALQQIVVHPDYATQGYPDLALLQLSQPSQQVPVDLVQEGSGLDGAGTIATTIGWGLTDPDSLDSAPAVLHQVSVPIVSFEVCERQYPGITESAMICAGLEEGGKDSCLGDSGGPLFVISRQGEKFQQAGVTSFGNGCAEPGASGVYARVATNMTWIDSVASGDGSVPVEPNPGTELTAVFSFSCEGLRCNFDASESTSDVAIDNYAWQFDDGAWDFGKRVEHQYASQGSYEVSLYVITEDGRITSATNTVTVDNDGPSTPNPGDGVSNQTSGTLSDDQPWVSTPEGGFAANEGSLTGILNGPDNADFDLYLEQLDETSGLWNVVAASTSDTSSEEIVHQAAAGTYQWSVVAYDGAGDFTLTTNSGEGVTTDKDAPGNGDTPVEVDAAADDDAS